MLFPVPGLDPAEGLPHPHRRQVHLHPGPPVSGAVQPRRPGLDTADQVRFTER